MYFFFSLSIEMLSGMNSRHKIHRNLITNNATALCCDYYLIRLESELSLLFVEYFIKFLD
jgi:hypothetical protein